MAGALVRQQESGNKCVHCVSGTTRDAPLIHRNCLSATAGVRASLWSSAIGLVAEVTVTGADFIGIEVAASSSVIFQFRYSHEKKRSAVACVVKANMFWFVHSACGTWARWEKQNLTNGSEEGSKVRDENSDLWHCHYLYICTVGWSCYLVSTIVNTN